MFRKLLIGLVVIVALVFAAIYVAGRGTFGSHEGPGEVTTVARPQAAVDAVASAVEDAALDVGVARPKQILFGDLHVHTTFSFDAFMFSLPLMAGEGAHPPADACDFARYCSALDFWSINDHAFSITKEHWDETVDSVRQCNDVAGDPANPDTVAFLGWEWTQVGVTPEGHYGHKNIVLRGTDDDEIPDRPIASMRIGGGIPPTLVRGVGALVDGSDRMHDLSKYWTEWGDTPVCEVGTPVADLPDGCIDMAETPADLFARLDEYGTESIVIPHGTTWGFYTPPGSTWDKQLAGANDGPEHQTLIEVYSGHGDSERYRDFRAVDFDADGNASCPEPSDAYLPSCWRAGEIIEERCLAAGDSDAECAARAVAARQHAVDAGVGIGRTVAGAEVEDWLDAGQCQDCDEPSFNYRPGGSAQYILAIGNFDEDPTDPKHFRMGFMASSDNHFGRPGTGYKEKFRRGMTESQGQDREEIGAFAGVILPPQEEPEAKSKAFTFDQPGFQVFEVERMASFLTTGGLIGTHAEGRDRDSIWNAMQRREVYGTSGPRMLMWFDLLNAPDSRGGATPMGSELSMSDSPIFQVRAVGSFEQRDGCPDYASEALGPERLEHVCKGECYYPSDQRRNITRIEVVRIRPQKSPQEDVADLIDDPWRSFTCEPDPSGCVITFADPDFARLGRDTVYYARAFEEEKPVINGGNVRCERDDAGRCIEANPCPGPDGLADDCLAPVEPRAWSSPIWVDYSDRRALVALDSGA